MSESLIVFNKETKKRRLVPYILNTMLAGAIVGAIFSTSAIVKSSKKTKVKRK